jgi:estrogen-related receptor beta like 1
MYKYITSFYLSIYLLGLTFIEIKHKLEELEKKGAASHNTVAKYTNELVEITEKLDELKESYESKDVGIHDTSPLIKIKTALQQIKSDIYNFDMRIGVVSNTLLAARIQDHHRLRSKANNNARRRHNKQKQEADDNSLLSGDDE